MNHKDTFKCNVIVSWAYTPGRDNMSKFFRELGYFIRNILKIITDY